MIFDDLSFRAEQAGVFSFTFAPANVSARREESLFDFNFDFNFVFSAPETSRSSSS